MTRDKKIDIENARKILNVEKALFAGLLSLLLEKGIIEQADLQSIRKYCEIIFKEFQRLDQPILKIHSEEVERELNHFLSSFRSKPNG